MYHIREKKLRIFEISELFGPDVRTIYNWTLQYTISDDICINTKNDLINV